MHGINILLWVAMVGVTFFSGEITAARTMAIAGLVVAALWEHASRRGFFKAKRTESLAAK